MHHFKSFSKVVALILALGLSACVTTMEGGNPATDPNTAVETYIQLGLGYLRTGNRDAARLNFSKALEIDKRSAGAHDGLALLYQLEAMNDLAESHFKRAIRYDRN